MLQVFIKYLRRFLPLSAEQNSRSLHHRQDKEFGHDNWANSKAPKILLNFKLN